MLTDPWFYAVAIPAVLITGVSKSGFLGGLSGLGVPLLALVISPVQAAGIMLPILLAMDAVGVWAYRDSFDTANLKIMLPGALVGIGIGWLTAAWVTDAHVRLIVGLLGVAFTIDYWLKLRPTTAAGPRGLIGLALSALSGFTSFVSHNGGPPAQIHLLPQRLPNALYAGTLVMFFAAVNLIKVPPYLMLGQLDRGNLLTSALLLPVAVAAMLGGLWLVRRVPQEPFYQIAYLTLFLVSLKLLWDGASAL